jgi:hypothetical protein
VLEISTGTETLLVDSLYGFYVCLLSYNSIEYAVNKDDLAFNKENLASFDSIIHLKNLHNNTAAKIILPIKGIPIFLNPSGNLLIYRNQKGYNQFDFVSQQSLFLYYRRNKPGKS